jgi:hypothetical protein
MELLVLIEAAEDAVLLGIGAMMTPMSLRAEVSQTDVQPWYSCPIQADLNEMSSCKPEVVDDERLRPELAFPSAMLRYADDFLTNCTGIP